MDLAQIIVRNLKPVFSSTFISPPLATTSPFGGAAPSAEIAGFHVPHQEQENWCWAGVAVGVASLYGAVWQQCNLASLELGQHCCPTGANSRYCNVAHFLDRALTRVGHFDRFISSPIPFNHQLIDEIIGRRPVGVRIAWRRGAHFVAIKGYSTIGGQFVDVEDPWYSSSTLPYARFLTAYQRTGTWTHTYFTN